MQKNIRKNYERKEEELSINEKCWYREVCNKSGECEGCIKYLEMSYLIEHSGIPKLKQLPPILKPSNDEDEQMFVKLIKIKNNIVTSVKNGENFYLTSSTTGNGKTSWAIKLLLKYFDEIWAGNGLRVRGLFIHVPTFFMDLKDFDNPLPKKYRELLKNCDLVIWDDIASTGMSDYDCAQFVPFIDYRLMAQKSNIYTSNISDRKLLEELLGPRLTSRIYNSSKIITLTGKDHRHG